MQTQFIQASVSYTGQELRPHWIYDQTELLGDAIVGFVGPCDVTLAHMVDLEDVHHNAPIYSPQMLHFIVELFDTPLKTGIAFQRLMMAVLQDEINQRLGKMALTRQGDDLFDLEARKLSVSIATVSPTSTLIHVGLNMETKGTPVPTVGLVSDFSIADIPAFAQTCLSHFQNEWLAIHHASVKVRGVGS